MKADIDHKTHTMTESLDHHTRLVSGFTAAACISCLTVLSALSNLMQR